MVVHAKLAHTGRRDLVPQENLCNINISHGHYSVVTNFIP